MANVVTPRPTIMYRYEVIETWGRFPAEVGARLLERRDQGEDRQWEIWSDKEGEIIGGAVGEFFDCVYLCPCGKYLTTKEHECPWRR